MRGTSIWMVLWLAGALGKAVRSLYKVHADFREAPSRKAVGALIPLCESCL